MPHDKKGRLVEVGDHVRFSLADRYDEERKAFVYRDTIGRVFSVSPSSETCNVSAVHLAPDYWPIRQATFTAKESVLVLKADGSEVADAAPLAEPQADGAGR